MFEDEGEHHGYDTAQICLNGHVVNPHHDSRPGGSRNYCPDCGAKTVTSCPNCNGWLPGLHRRLSAEMDAPAFCTECGKRYPWHASKVNAAKAFAEELAELDDDEKRFVLASIEELASASPNADTAALRLKRATSKLPLGSARTLLKLVAEAAVGEGAKAALAMFFPPK